MPFLAVRNLVEVACIPFLMLGAWRLIPNSHRWSDMEGCVDRRGLDRASDERAFPNGLFLRGGTWLGLAFPTTMDQEAFLSYGAGVLIPLGVIQGGIDFFLWGRPFAELTQYVMYNLANTARCASLV